ncbi:MAG TPA: MFS transporter [Candidatus Limnocylindrales bacterium]
MEESVAARSGASPEPLLDTPVFSATTVVAACLSFVLIGALGAFYGPLIPVFEVRYGIGPSAAAAVLSAHAVGALLGVLAASQALRILTNRSFLVASLAILAVGFLVFAAAPAWWAVLAGAGILGFGFGALDLGVNQLFAYSFGARAGTMLNVLNGVYGIGAVAGPLLVATVAPGGIGPLYLGCAVFAAVLIVPLRRVRGDGTPSDGKGASAVGRTGGRGVVLTVGLFAIAYALYVGVESGVGGWEPSHLAALGLSAAAASSATSAFWLGLTAGRFLIAPVALRVRPARIVLISIGAGIVTLALATIPGLAPVAYAATGLAIAPIYPTGIAWLAGATPGRRTPTVYLVGASMIGAAIFPPLVGLAIQDLGTAVTPVALAILAVGSASAFAGVAVTGRRLRGAPGPS